MSKWEYCAVVGIAKSQRNPSHYFPAVWFFTPGGTKIVEIGGQEGFEVSKMIAQLGEDGWEMVGIGTMPDRHAQSVNPSAIYFKRPCGGPERVHQDEAAAPKEAGEEEVLRCDHCNAVVSEEDKICPACGIEFEE